MPSRFLQMAPRFTSAGMNFTTDKLKSLVKKWHSLIECFADVKTTDGYYMRLFCIGFTKKQQNQVRKTSYAQSSQIRQVWCARFCRR